MTERVMPNGFKPVFRRNNVANRKRVRALERRREYLEDLIRAGRARDFDRSEAKALEWAVPICQEWMDSDPVFDVDVAPEEFSGELPDWIGLLGTGTYICRQEQAPAIACEIVGVNPQEQRIALRIDDGTRPIKDGPLLHEVFDLEGTPGERVSL